MDPNFENRIDKITKKISTTIQTEITQFLNNNIDRYLLLENFWQSISKMDQFYKLVETQNNVADQVINNIKIESNI